MASRQTWIWSATAAFVVASALTLVIGRSGGCDDERPPLDDHVGDQGKAIAEADPRSQELAVAREKFAKASDAQLVVLGAEIERHATTSDTPRERIEALRRDHALLREQRRQVLEATDASFQAALTDFETQVRTVREQLERADDGRPL